MKDEHKVIIAGIIAGLGIYSLQMVIPPLESYRESHWEWLIREMPKFAILIVAGVAAHRTLVRHRQAEGETRRLQREMTIRDKITSAFLTFHDEDVYREVLRIILEALESEHGIFGYLSEDGNLICTPMTGEPGDRCQTTGKEIVVRCEKLTGIWGRAINDKELSYSNTPVEALDGQSQLLRAVAIPVLHQGDVIGLMAAANKPSDYDEKDRELLRTIAEQAAPMLNLRLQKDRHEKACKQLKEDKERIQAQLHRAQQMEDFGVFASGIVHKLDNLLSTIKDRTDLAMRMVGPKTALYRNLNQIHDTAVRAGSLTQKLRLFRNKNQAAATPIDLNRVVHEVLKMVGHLMGDDITINACLEPELWTARIDKAGIEQVIMNLAVNARDAMPEGGRLTIITENVTLKREHCEIMPEARPGKFVCLSVTDTGSGMDKETIRRIFEPFFTTKDPGKGTGLGLTVVQGIARRHNGWITVYSEPGRGSTFGLYLPALSVTQEAQSQETTSLPEFQGSGQRILLVEDDEPIREFVTTVLTDNGLVVYDAASSNEALSIFERENGEFDLLFSDIVLPDEDGLRLAERLLSLKPELQVLLTSGYMDEEAEWIITCEKGFQFLRKPFAIADLLRAIRTIIESTKVRPEEYSVQLQT